MALKAVKNQAPGTDVGPLTLTVHYKLLDSYFIQISACVNSYQVILFNKGVKALSRLLNFNVVCNVLGVRCSLF